MKRRGYTLIETVFYAAIIGVVVAFSISAIVAMYRVFGMLRIDRKLSLNGDVAIETMIRDIRSASSVNLAGSTLGTHPGVLQLDSKQFSLSGTELRVFDGATTKQLTASDARVSNILFYHETNGSSENPSAIVSVRMTIEAGKGVLEKSKTYYGSAVLRGAY